MHLYISVSNFVFGVSLTHSLRQCKPHLARQIHYQLPFTLNAIKIRIILTRKTTCLHATVISCAWLWRLCLRRWQQESAQNQQDLRLTGQSPIWAGHARNWPIPITGRSIGASLITLHVPRNRNTQYRLKHQRSIPLWECACEMYGL